MRRSSNGAKNTRFKHPHAHICRHAPETPQNRAAMYHYAAHSRLPSHQRPPTAAYAPDCQTSPTFSFQTVWMGLLFEFDAGFLFWPRRGNQKLTKSLPWRPSKGEKKNAPLGPPRGRVPLGVLNAHYVVNFKQTQSGKRQMEVTSLKAGGPSQSRRCAPGGPTGPGNLRGPCGPKNGPKSGPQNGLVTGGGSGQSVTAGLTDQPTFRRAK